MAKKMFPPLLLNNKFPRKKIRLVLIYFIRRHRNGELVMQISEQTVSRKYETIHHGFRVANNVAGHVSLLYSCQRASKRKRNRKRCTKVVTVKVY